MGKWIITVSDEDDGIMHKMADSMNPVWVKQWVGDAAEVEDMQKLD